MSVGQGRRRDVPSKARHQKLKNPSYAQATYPTFSLADGTVGPDVPKVPAGNHAKYIGRVGMLAVALGVGAAVTTGHGLGAAHADTGVTSTDSPTRDARSDDTSRRPSSSPMTPGASTNPASGDTATDVELDDIDTADPELDDTELEDLETGDAQLGDSDAVDEPTVDVDDDSPTDVEDVPSPEEAAASKSESKRQSASPSSARRSSADAAPLTGPEGGDGSATPEQPVAPNDPESPSGPESTTSDENEEESGSDTVRTSLPDESQPRAAASSASSPDAVTAVGGIQEFVSTLLSPLVAPGPTAPAHPPLLWAVLGWISREIQRTFFNRTPDVRPQDITLVLDPGETSGPIAFDGHDAERDAITYYVPTRGVPGGPQHGTVVVDQSTGTFTYTPDAGFTGTDEFVVTASDAGRRFHLHGLFGFLKPNRGHAHSAKITLNIGAPAGAPTANNDAFQTAENDVVVGNVLSNDGDPAHQNLVATLLSRPSHGSVTLNANGEFTYTPNPDWSGTDEFTYSAANSTSSSVASVTITVTPVNQAPIALDDHYTTTEDTPISRNVLTNDSDREGATVTAEVVTGASHGVVEFNADGSFTYTPDADFNGIDYFSYVASDGLLTSAPTVVTITVVAANDAPVARDDLFSIDEDAILTGSVLHNDTDVDSDPLTVSLTSGPTHGQLYLNPDGTFTFTPFADYNGTDSFTYTVSDGTATATATATITIAPVNDAPIAHDGSFTVGEGASHTGTVDVEDAEDGPVIVTVVDGPNHGTLTLNTDGSFVYTPDADYSGSDWFAYAVSDGTLSSAPAVIQIVITPANNAPVAHDDHYAMNEDAILAGSVLFNDNDVDRDTLTATVASGPGHGVLVLLEDGSFIYTPTANYAGTDSFTYTVSDGTATSNTATVTITINPVNDVPVAGDDIYDVDEGGELTGNVLTNDRDVESSSLTATLVDGPANGTVVLNSDGTFTYTPATNFDGVDWFTYTASDGTAVSTPAVVVIVVKPVNNAPVATDDSYTVAEDGVLVGDVLSNDVESDNDSLTVSLVKGPAHGVLKLNDDGTFVYTPAANYNGTDSFTYIVGDGSLTSQEATVTITVTPVNNAPVAVGDSFSTDEDRELSGNVLTNDTDIDGDSLTAELVAGPAHGMLVLNADGTFTYTPTANYHGTDTFTYTVSDGEATSSVTTVSLTINAVNDAPVAGGDSFTIDEDSVLTGDLLTNDTDIDQDDLTATVVAGPAHGTLTLNADGTFTYTPDADYHGTDTFTYTVSDGEATSSVATVSLTINAVNDAPVAGNDSFTFDEDHVLTGGVLANDNDRDGDPLTATLVDGPANGTLTFNADGTFTYTPDADYHGTDTFTYTVNDGTTTSSVATVSLTVNSVNDAPVSGNDNFTVGEDSPLAGNVLTNDNDVDRDALTVTVVAGPAHGTLTLNADGSFSYIPDPDYHGVDSFTYRASDGSTTGNTALVTIAVTAVNDAPVANHDSVATNEDTPVTGNVLTNDRDADGNPLTATVVSGPANGTLTFNADGTFTYTPDADYNGTDTFTYEVGDGITSSVATVSITINPVNDAPVAGNDNYTTDEDTALTGNVLTNDRDADGNPLTATLVTGPAHGTLTLNADGTFTYTPTADYNGTDSFTYTAGDGTAASTTATVIITVNPVNDAPVAGNDNYTTNEDTQLTGNVLTNDRDADGNPLTTTLVAGPANGTLTFNEDGTFTYTPTADYSGTDTFTYEVGDGITSSVATVSITINPVNDAPVAGNDNYTTNEDTALTGNVLTNDRDADGNPLTATLVTGPAHGTLTLHADGSFEYNPHANYSGTDVFTYTISDGTLNSHVAIVSIAVTAINDAPVAVGDSYTINEDTPLTGNVLTNDTDADGNTLTATLEDDPANGAVTFRPDGTFTYIPNANYHGTDTFTYKVSDGITSSVATVSITIDPVNNAPTAVGDSFTTNEDTALTGNVLTNDSDIDRDPLTATLVTGPAHGTLTLNGDGTFTYTPTANYHGTDSFSYAAGDGVTSSVATVTIAVNPVNDAPVATGDTVTTTQNTTVIVDVRTNDTDVDNPRSGLTVAVQAGPKNGTLTLNADGTFTYTPNTNYIGTDSFTYTVSDGTATSNIATVSITVVDNIAPRAVNVQTTNGGGLFDANGRLDSGDTITYTFSERIDPTSILAGWNGTTIDVVVRAYSDLGSNDTVQVYNSSDNALLPLGTIDLGRSDYVVGLGYLRFGALGGPSRMTMTGNTITVVLGTLVPMGASQGHALGSGTMVWTPSTTPRDLAGNALTSTPATESGSADRDF